MNTTTLFFEQLIVGCQAAVWIFLFIISLFQPNQIINWVTGLRDWANLLSIVAIAIIFSIGVIVDRVFDVIIAFLKPHVLLAKIKLYKVSGKNFHTDDLIRVYKEANILESYIQYIVSRTRVARATIINIPLITVAILVNINIRLHPWIAITLILIGIFATIMSIITYSSLVSTLQNRGRQLLNDPKAKIMG